MCVCEEKEGIEVVEEEKDRERGRQKNMEAAAQERWSGHNASEKLLQEQQEQLEEAALKKMEQKRAREEGEAAAEFGQENAGAANGAKRFKVDSEDGIFVGEITAKNRKDPRRVHVKNYNGKVLVSIREFYSKEGSDKFLPGRKGISLSIEQYGRGHARTIHGSCWWHSISLSLHA